MFKYNHVDEDSKIVFNQKAHKIMANKDKDVKLTFTLKDKKGKTFTNVDSLKIQTKVSDDSLLEPETTHAVIPNTKITQYAHIPSKRKDLFTVFSSFLRLLGLFLSTLYAPFLQLSFEL